MKVAQCHHKGDLKQEDEVLHGIGARKNKYYQ